MKTNYHPYRFSFVSESLNGGNRVYWVRFYPTHQNIYQALDDCKEVALRENTDARLFFIEDDQDSEDIRKSWGLPN